MKVIRKKKYSRTQWNDMTEKRPQQIRLTIQVKEINKKNIGKRRQTQKKNAKQAKQDLQKKKKKFYRQVGGEYTKTYQQPDLKETKQFWCMIWEQKKCNKKAKWINNKKK